MRRFVISLMLGMLFLVTVEQGFGAEAVMEEPVFAIQEKVFHKYHELSVLTGYNGGEDFYHIYPLGLSYTFHFDDHISWEVARFYANFTVEKALLENLLNDFGRAPEQGSFYEPKYQLVSHLVIRPFYGKDAVLNKHILNHETYFLMGGGIEMYSENFAGDAISPKDNVAGIISLGAGIKYFINEDFNVAFEVRDYVTFRDDPVNIVWFGINFGFRFNLGSRPSYSDETLDILEGYLKDE